MGRKVAVDELADAVMEELDEFAELTADEMKAAVRETASDVRADIRDTAPRDTGAYAKSWAVAKERETAEELSMVVYSKNRYQIAHLLEFGHAKRGGGRVRAYPHIAPARERGERELEQELERRMEHG